jgi:hypothetical protein
MTNKKILMTSIIAMTLIFAGSLSIKSAEAATGDMLADYAGSCFGTAFNGTHLWCSQGIGDNILDVIETSTGTVSTDELVTNPPTPLVSLAYDHSSNALWGNVAGQPINTLVKIDPATGNILDTIVTTVPHNVHTWSDGLSYDEITDSLWMSPEDAGTNNNVYEIDPSNGNTLQTLNFPGPINGWSGVAVTGDSMWMDDKAVTMHQFNMTGDPLTTFAKVGNSEDLAFDDKTFEGKCAIWAAQTLIAYEIPCPDIQKVCDEYNSVEICKIADIRDDGDKLYTVGEVIEFDFAIVVHTSSTTLINVEVKDRLGGDLMSFENSLMSTDGLDCTLGTPNAGNNDKGNKKGGKTQKEFLDCVATPNGELEPNSWEEITFSAKTDVNPGQQKKQEADKEFKNEYTSCGVHEINSGATIQYWWFGQDPEVDEPTELKTPAISVDVFDQADLLGDCDGDEILDIDDDFPFDFDNDGVNDEDDLCIDEPGLPENNGCPV